MHKHLYKERAMIKFRRYYMHGVRNEYDFEKSATDALWKTREEILTELKIDPSFASNVEREDIWSSILEDLMIFRMMLKDIPIDKAKMEELREKRIKEETGLEQRIKGITGPADVVAEALVVGIESITNEGKKDGTKT